MELINYLLKIYNAPDLGFEALKEEPKSFNDFIVKKIDESSNFLQAGAWKIAQSVVYLLSCVASALALVLKGTLGILDLRMHNNTMQDRARNYIQVVVPPGLDPNRDIRALIYCDDAIHGEYLAEQVKENPPSTILDGYLQQINLICCIYNTHYKKIRGVETEGRGFSPDNFPVKIYTYLVQVDIRSEIRNSKHAKSAEDILKRFQVPLKGPLPALASP